MAGPAAERLLLVPAAGRAVRMGGLLKELLPLGTESPDELPSTVLRRSLELGLAADVDRVAVVTSSAKAPALMEAISSFAPPVPVVYVHQPEPTGLGAAVLCAEAEIRRSRATLLLMPDTIVEPLECGANVLELVEGGATAAACLHAVPDPERFGVAQLDDGHVAGFVDKPAAAPSRWVWTLAAFSSEFLELVRRSRPTEGEWGLTEALDLAARDSALAASFVDDGSYHDVGTYEGYLGALQAGQPVQP